MLNKAICKRCYKKHHIFFSEVTAQRWKENRFICVKNYFKWLDRGTKYSFEVYTDVKSEPPEDCEYVLEHMVSQEC